MPAVVRASERFLVRTTQENCWAFFSNLENIGACIPGCEEVSRIDGATAIFRVKLKVGYLSKMLELRAKIKESVAPTHLSFTAEGSDAEITGSLDLKAEGSDIAATYSIEIVPVSVTGKTAVAMMGKDLVRKQASEFATCVKAKLEPS